VTGDRDENLRDNTDFCVTVFVLKLPILADEEI
jgi:hypothetical protein